MFSLTKHDHAADDEQPADGQVSQGPNSFDDAETSGGGADSVYGTPDATPSTAVPATTIRIQPNRNAASSP